MKQSTRLFIAFCFTIFLPIILVGVSFYSFRQIQMKQLYKKYGIETENYSYLINTVQLMNRYTQDEYDELLKLSEAEPLALEDLDYISKMNNILSEKNSYIVEYIGDEIFFNGSVGNEKLLHSLIEYDQPDGLDHLGTYVDDINQLIIKQISFDSSKGKTGQIFILTEFSGMSREVKEMITDLAISVVIILILTASLIAVWIHRGMISPIKKLQIATQNIMEDNLDFTIEATGKDEISELCRNFEEMRRRLKTLSEERIENERQNRELISNISHDLKTPLTTVRGYVEGIMDGMANTPEKMDKYVHTIYTKTNEMTRLVNELTLYSQINTNRIPYNFNKISVSEYFAGCRDDAKAELENQEIEFSYDNYVAQDVQIIADPEQIGRVINNIISNSIKYMDKNNPHIYMRIKDVGDFIQVEIEDNGKGIEARDLPYIFERFFRTDSSRNSMTGGSGIGLSIVKKIIEDHGGKIWATSRISEGTTMYFVIRKYQEVTVDE